MLESQINGVLSDAMEKAIAKASRHEEPIPAFVVGDSVEYIHGNSLLTLRK